jgi:hypothetical protein
VTGGVCKKSSVRVANRVAGENIPMTVT